MSFIGDGKSEMDLTGLMEVKDTKRNAISLEQENRVLKNMIVSLLDAYEKEKYIEDFEDNEVFLRFMYEAKQIRELNK